MLQTERLLARKEQRYSDALFCVFMYLGTVIECISSQTEFSNEIIFNGEKKLDFDCFKNCFFHFLPT